MIIYLLYCIQSHKGYIGQTTKSLLERWEQHKTSARSGSPFLIHRAIRKYGEESFEISVLSEVGTLDELNALEIHHINIQNTKVPNGYNLTDGGEGTPGRRSSEETKAKIALANVGKKHPPRSPEWRDKQRLSHLGIKHPPRSTEYRVKQSVSHKGREFSPEHKEALKIAWKNRIKRNKQ
jgi:group I intron endonuclease